MAPVSAHRVKWVTFIFSMRSHIQLCKHASRHFHVTGWSRSLERALMLSNNAAIQCVPSMSLGQQSILWLCAGEAAPRRRRRAGLTYWRKRRPLLYGWTWTAWRQREDDEQIELWLKQHISPLCELLQRCFPPFSASTYFLRRAPQSTFGGLVCAIRIYHTSSF